MAKDQATGRQKQKKSEKVQIHDGNTTLKCKRSFEGGYKGTSQTLLVSFGETVLEE